MMGCDEHSTATAGSLEAGREGQMENIAGGLTLFECRSYDE